MKFAVRDIRELFNDAAVCWMNSTYLLMGSSRQTRSRHFVDYGLDGKVVHAPVHGGPNDRRPYH
jgi:hypothetical protein